MESKLDSKLETILEKKFEEKLKPVWVELRKQRKTLDYHYKTMEIMIGEFDLKIMDHESKPVKIESHFIDN